MYKMMNKVKVLSMQPKQTGKDKKSVNVHVEEEEDEERRWVNWDHIDDGKELPHPENAVLLTMDQEMSQDVVDDKERERAE